MIPYADQNVYRGLQAWWLVKTGLGPVIGDPDGKLVMEVGSGLYIIGDDISGYDVCFDPDRYSAKEAGSDVIEFGEAGKGWFIEHLLHPANRRIYSIAGAVTFASDHTTQRAA